MNKIDEAIAFFRGIADWHIEHMATKESDSDDPMYDDSKCIDCCETALLALCEKRERERPLTDDEMLQLRLGDPVRIERFGQGIVSCKVDAVNFCNGIPTMFEFFDLHPDQDEYVPYWTIDYEKTWLAYADKPEGGGA